MRALKLALLVTLLFCAMLVTVVAAEKQIIAGAGPSTEIVKLFVNDFEKQPACEGISFEVPPKSVKHAGGIKCSDHNLFGRTGRPLNAKEKELNKGEIFLAKVPIAFASGSAIEVSQLNLSDLEKIYKRKITNWKEVGGIDAPIVLVGREPTEALFLELKEDYPFFKGIEFDILFKKDNHVVNFLKSPKGVNAIAFGAKPNFSELNLVRVEGFESGVRLGLVYDMSNQDAPAIKAAIDFSKSDMWQQKVKKEGLIALY